VIASYIKHLPISPKQRSASHYKVFDIETREYCIGLILVTYESKVQHVPPRRERSTYVNFSLRKILRISSYFSVLRFCTCQPKNVGVYRSIRSTYKFLWFL